MIELEINGSREQVDAARDTPLLWVLRDHLGLTGTKFGCGMALCGACTVHVDGEAVRSCVMPLWAVAGKKIRTIEGLGQGGLHVLQQTWIEHNVPQCGYCQSGQIMQAADLLANNADPSDADINVAMNGNLCRCMAYTRIRKAIKSAASSGEA